MQIQFLQTIATEQTCYVAGEVYDLPDADAEEFISAGIAKVPTPPRIPARFRMNGLLGFPIHSGPYPEDS